MFYIDNEGFLQYLKRNSEICKLWILRGYTMRNIVENILHGTFFIEVENLDGVFYGGRPYKILQK